MFEKRKEARIMGIAEDIVRCTNGLATMERAIAAARDWVDRNPWYRFHLDQHTYGGDGEFVNGMVALLRFEEMQRQKEASKGLALSAK